VQASNAPTGTPTPQPSTAPQPSTPTQTDSISIISPQNNSILTGRIQVKWEATGKAASHDIRAEYSINLGDSWTPIDKPHPMAQDQNTYFDTRAVPDGTRLMLRVFDKDNLQTRTLADLLTVDNTPPEADCGDYQTGEAQPIWLNASPASDGVSGIKSFYWLVNGTEESYEQKFMPLVIGNTFGSLNLPVVLTVVDNVGNNNTFKCFIRVSNVPPLPSIVSQDALLEGANFSFQGSFYDPGSGNGEKYTYRFDFGDGHSQDGNLSARHAFREPGTYNVVLTVSDGEQGNAEKRVTATNVLPTLTGFARIPSLEGPNRYLFGWNFTHPVGPIVIGAIEYQYTDEFGRTLWSAGCSASTAPFECIFDMDGLKDGAYPLRIKLDDGTEPVFVEKETITVTHPPV